MVEVYLTQMIDDIVRVKRYPPLKVIAHEIGISRQTCYRIIQGKPVSTQTMAKLVRCYVRCIGQSVLKQKAGGEEIKLLK